MMKSRIFGREITVRKVSHSQDGLPFGPIYPAATYSPWLADPEFQSVYAKVWANTMVDVMRLYELWSLAAQVNHLPGAFLEVGVRKGGSGCLLASRTTKPVYLCDTFTGVAKAGPNDPGMKGGEYATPASVVTDLATSMGLTNTRIVSGIFPDESGHGVPEERIALCHVDVDVYESAKGVTEWVLPRIVTGGVVIYDDYGWKGARGVATYVNEIRNDPRWLFLHNLNGHGVLVRR